MNTKGLIGGTVSNIRCVCVDLFRAGLLSNLGCLRRIGPRAAVIAAAFLMAPPTSLYFTIRHVQLPTAHVTDFDAFIVSDVYFFGNLFV